MMVWNLSTSFHSHTSPERSFLRVCLARLCTPHDCMSMRCFLSIRGTADRLSASCCFMHHKHSPKQKGMASLEPLSLHSCLLQRNLPMQKISKSIFSSNPLPFMLYFCCGIKYRYHRHRYFKKIPKAVK